MSNINCFAVLIFLINLVYLNSASDTFYCQAEPLVYDICRRCNTTNEDCERSPRCQCDNIKIAATAKKNCKKRYYWHNSCKLHTMYNLYFFLFTLTDALQGGSDCETTSSKNFQPWCYVSEYYFWLRAYSSSSPRISFDGGDRVNSSCQK